MMLRALCHLWSSHLGTRFKGSIRWMGSGAVRDSFRTLMVLSRATFLALAPEEVALPRIAAPDNAARRGEVVEASLSGPGASGTRAALVRGRTPYGQDAEWLRQASGPRTNGCVTRLSALSTWR